MRLVVGRSSGAVVVSELWFWVCHFCILISLYLGGEHVFLIALSGSLCRCRGDPGVHIVGSGVVHYSGLYDDCRHRMLWARAEMSDWP
jgi:hypothetical protein